MGREGYSITRHRSETRAILPRPGPPSPFAQVRLLAERRTCICGEIVDELPLSRSTVSQHLKVLKDAGLIIGEVEGPAVCYCLAPGALTALHEATAKLSADGGQGRTVATMTFENLEVVHDKGKRD